MSRSARDFYELDFPSDEVAAEVMLIAFGALVLLETVWQFSRRTGRGLAAAVGVGNAGDDELVATASPSS